MLAKSTKPLIIMVMVALLTAATATMLFAAHHEGENNTYILKGGEQHWYTLTTQSDGAEVSVYMNVHPDGGASFQVATPDAVRAWTKGGDLQSVGTGTSGSGKADLAWTGNLGPAGKYHLIVEHQGDSKNPAEYEFKVSGADYSADGDYTMAGDSKESGSADAPSPEVTPAADLSTASAVSVLSNQPGRAIVSARGNHFVVDSIPPLGGPNEERNPMDLLLGAQATCSTFIYETAAQELGFAITGPLTATVQADLNPAGIASGSPNPRIQAMRIYMDVPGLSDEQKEQLKDEMMARCPLYTTMERAVPIEVSHIILTATKVAEGLSTASAVSVLSNQPGRAIVSARGNHFVVDSVPPLGGPNEERNPMDLLLGAQATCATFIYETAAQEMGIPLTGISATVEADLDPSGIKDGAVNPRVQAMRVIMDLEGATAEQAAKLQGEMEKRCPVYTTLIQSMPIEVTNVTN